MTNKQLLLATVAGGFFFYSLTIAWEVLFPPVIPTDRGAIVEIEPVDDDGCALVRFRSSTDEAIYYHNVEMQNRYRWWVYGSMFSGPLLGVVIGILLHRLGRSYDGGIVGLVFLGFVSSCILPIVIGFILPAPSRWLPDRIEQYVKANVERHRAALRMPDYPDDERLTPRIVRD